MNVTIWPRAETERGGIAMMPMWKNVPEGHPDWKLVKCPRCGQPCWDRPALQKLVQQQGAIALCTECAIREDVKGAQA